METQTNTPKDESVAARTAWEHFQQKNINKPIQEVVENLIFFLRAEHHFAREVVGYINNHPHSALLCTELHDNELAVFVIKEALIKKYQDAKRKEQIVPLQINRIINEIKNCYFFSKMNLVTLYERLPA